MEVLKSFTGIVYKSTGSNYVVKAPDANFYDCRIKGKFRLKGIKSTNPIAVGDIVDVEINQSGDETIGAITNIHERKNYLIRKSVNLSKQTHIIAANIDIMFILVTINQPITTTSFIDRLLVTAEAYGIKAILLFNKTDVYDDDMRDEQMYLQYIYQSIGYTCLKISAETGEGLEKLKELMYQKVCMFTGHSGVGKSTLVNTLQPGLALKTKAISEIHNQGQHTTTFAEMYDVDFDAKIIDTPGIRGFGLVDMEPNEVSDYFPEFFKLKAQCKFHNCLHKDEPHCGVKDALENDDVAWSRYKSYLQIINGEEENYRMDNHE